MNNKNLLMLLIIVSLLLFSLCDKIGGGRKGGIIRGEEEKADIRIKQIISAIKNENKESLKSLFSKKVVDEAKDFEKDIDYLFELLQGNVDSWERDGWSSDTSIEHGKKSLMIRFSFDIKTDKDIYHFFVIDYNTDTISTDNQGVYMLELIKYTDEKDLESWQDRMRAGLYIH